MRRACAALDTPTIHNLEILENFDKLRCDLGRSQLARFGASPLHPSGQGLRTNLQAFLESLNAIVDHDGDRDKSDC